ncbi:TenA family protein [Nocardia arthritidis]|uniref:TenA family protein n=1 Tax=Nocardia arthritidis TaxID=228602 RepID=UPI0007A3AF95|nr:hypothetical protein [Nocardia arthritidis]
MTTFIEECDEFTAEVWAAYKNHPWIEALAGGTLTVAQFSFFQIDDGAHVAEFNRALALGIAKAPVGHPWARAAAHVLDDMSTSAELSEKQSLLDELGVERRIEHSRWKCSPAREGYVNHLVRTAYEGSLGDIATSLYPCSLFTVVIGERFRNTDMSHSAFKRWTDMYTRRTRNEMREQHFALIEATAATADSVARDRMRQIYRRSLEHQVRVFDAAWVMDQQWPGAASNATAP